MPLLDLILGFNCADCNRRVRGERFHVPVGQSICLSCKQKRETVQKQREEENRHTKEAEQKRREVEVRAGRMINRFNGWKVTTGDEAAKQAVAMGLTTGISPDVKVCAVHFVPMNCEKSPFCLVVNGTIKCNVCGRSEPLETVVYLKSPGSSGTRSCKCGNGIDERSLGDWLLYFPSTTGGPGTIEVSITKVMEK